MSQNSNQQMSWIENDAKILNLQLSKTRRLLKNVLNRCLIKFRLLNLICQFFSICCSQICDVCMQNQVYKGQLFECQQIFLQKELQRMSISKESKSLKIPSQPQQQTCSEHSSSKLNKSKDPINQNRSQISSEKDCDIKDSQSQILSSQMVCSMTHEIYDQKQATVYETQVFPSETPDSLELKKKQDISPIETQKASDSKPQCKQCNLSNKNENQSSKYKILTEAQKQYLVKLAKETSMSHVVRKYNISRNNLIRWQKGCLRKKGAGRKVQSEDFEQKMVAYVKQLIDEGIQPTGKIVRSKAKELHQNPNFKASKGWFTRFLSRHIHIFPSHNFLPSQTQPTK